MNKKGQTKHAAEYAVSAREIAIDILTDIEQNQAFSNLLLQQELRRSELDIRDRALTTELVYGTLQRQNTLDYVANFFMKKRTVAELEPWVRQLLRISIYQARYLDKIPDRAIVFEAVEIAKRRGHQGIASFINGVIRNILRSPEIPEIPDSQVDPLQHIALTYSLPNWLVELWLRQYSGEQLTAFLQHTHTAPPFTVRRNRLKSDREAFEAKLDQAGIPWQKSVHIDEAYHLRDIGDVAQNSMFQAGDFSVQDESSMLVAKVLDPFPQAQILDACAAPGGKTTHIAELQNDLGKIVANDLYPHRVTLIDALAKRLGIQSIRTSIGDFLDYNEQRTFDYVVLDAPCSGLGVMRRKPELKWNLRKETITSLVTLQNQLIRHAAGFVKRGGYLVYSTCTINRPENERVIEEFLKEFPDFTGADIRAQLPEALHVHMKNPYSVQVLPHYINSDGFYIAKLIKK